MLAKTLKLLLKKRVIWVTFLIFGSLHTIENAVSLQRKHWNRDYMKFSFNEADTAIIMKYEFFDYEFGPANENGYLEYCDFYYIKQGENDMHFMTAATDDQFHKNWSWVNMSNKLSGTRLQFIGTYVPVGGTMWSDDTSKLEVRTPNTYDPSGDDLAWITIKWYLGTKYKDVYTIRIIGKWHVNGLWPSENFNEMYSYESIKSAIKTFNSNDSVKVYTEADAVVIKGADIKENINVYTTAGSQIKSIIANDDLVKIKLPKNQIYIVHIGLSRYKVAM